MPDSRELYLGCWFIVCAGFTALTLLGQLLKSNWSFNTEIHLPLSLLTVGFLALFWFARKFDSGIPMKDWSWSM